MHWQAVAHFANGGVMVFGVKAGTRDQALDLARERLACVDSLVDDFEVRPLG